MARLDLDVVRVLSLVDEPEVGDAQFLVTKRHDVETVRKKSVAGVSFSGTKSGSLDESEIPNDDYKSHYLFDADTKSASSCPVVDADGNLRRGNVESAYQLGARGGVSEEDLYSKLRKLNDEFENPPIDPEDIAKRAQTGAEPGGSGTGRDAVTEDSIPMEEDQLDERLEEHREQTIEAATEAVSEEIQKALGDDEAEPEADPEPEFGPEDIGKAVADELGETEPETEPEPSEEFEKKVKAVMKSIEGGGRKGQATQTDATGDDGEGYSDTFVADAATSGGDD